MIREQNPSSIISKELIRFLRERFQLDWEGIHGAPHWARVKRNGLRLAKETKANIEVVELFAFLHDVERQDEGLDKEHGYRSGKLAKELNGDLFKLNSKDLDLLVKACEGHSNGNTFDEITVMTCWDADRLDLGRVDIMPIPEKLCTDIAKQKTIIAWAYKNSIG